MHDHSRSLNCILGSLWLYFSIDMAFMQLYKENKLFCVFLNPQNMFFLPLFFGGGILFKIIFHEQPPNLCKFSHMLKNKSRYILITPYTLRTLKCPKDLKFLDRNNSLVI